MPDDTTSEAPKPLTAEEIANLVNSAITAHDKRNEKRRSDEVAKLIADAVAKVAPAPPTAGTTITAGAEAGRGDNPELAALRAKLEETNTKLEKQAEITRRAEEARVAAENKARDDRAFNDLRTHLSKHVRPEMLDAVAKLHFHADKRVDYAEDGTPLFKVKRSPGGGLPEEDVLMPLADGVKYWAGLKDNAVWLPAPSSNGASGGTNAARGTGRPPTVRTYDKAATTDDEKVRRAMEREQALAEKFNT